MRTGRAQRVDLDIVNRKAVIDLQHEIKKLRDDMDDSISTNK